DPVAKVGTAIQYIIVYRIIEISTGVSVVYRNTVNNVQRVVAPAQGCESTNDHLIGATGSSGAIGDLHARDFPLKGIEKARVPALSYLRSVEFFNRIPERSGFPLHAQRRNDYLPQLANVLRECDVYDISFANCNLFRDQADEGKDQCPSFRRHNKAILSGNIRYRSGSSTRKYNIYTR